MIPRAQRRGAEVDGMLLADALAGEYEPLVATLFAGGDPAVLGGRAPVRVGAAPARTGPLGLSRPAAVDLRATMLEVRPDIVVAYGGAPLLHAVRAAGRSGPPVLYVKIAMSAPKARRGPGGFVIRRALRRAAGLAAVAPHLAQELTDDLRVRREVHVTPTFRTEADRPKPGDRESFRAELGLGPHDVLVAFVGSLSPEKGPDLALAAVAATPRAVHLAVAGTGPLADALRLRVRQLGVGDRVHLLGSRTDVPGILAGSDLVLLSSREEGRPGVVLEAALAERPTVAFAVGGVPDLITHDVNGLLVHPGDVEALAEAVSSLAADPSRAAAMGREAGKAAGGYLADAVLPAWRDAFRATRAGRRSARPSTA